MAHLIGLQGVKALAGSRVLLDDINLGLEDGSRVGILGPNGAGKSTLLRLISGAQAPDGGMITVTDGTRVSMLVQSDQMDPDATVLNVIHPGGQEHEWAGNRDFRRIHEGLLSDLSLDDRVGTLSGGQRRRVALAAGLSQDANVLLLDEPTNHLDVEGVAWLAQYLKERFNAGSGRGTGALVVVTHDRWFLDEICTRVWEVVPGVDPGGNRPQIAGRVEQYDGSYAAYVLARAERVRQAQVAEEKRQNLLRKELAWLRRGAPARTSKPKFRIDAAEELIANEPAPRDQAQLLSMATARLGKDVLDLEDASLAFTRPDGSPLQVLDHVTWRLAPAQRIGVVGVNGAGKTTLLRLLEGVLQPDSGRVRRGKTVKVATLSQSTHELDAVSHLRVVEAVSEVAQMMTIGKKELTASQLVERLGFTRDRAWTPVAELSGGERRRLQLMRLLMTEPNVLLLDEPTNDLDTDTLAAMEDLLDGFPGTLVVVSHDRYLLERVTDTQVAVMGDGKLRMLPGGVEQYLQMRAEGVGGAAGHLNRSASTLTSDMSSENTGAEVETGLSAQQRRQLVKEAAKIERQMERARAQMEELSAKLAQLSELIVSDSSKAGELADLGREQAQISDQVDELETRWLELTEQIEG